MLDRARVKNVRFKKKKIRKRFSRWRQTERKTQNRNNSRNKEFQTLPERGNHNWWKNLEENQKIITKPKGGVNELCQEGTVCRM